MTATINYKTAENYYTSMCKDIAAEKRRMGGDFVVAHAVPTRAFRDHIREQLGPDLIFVVLNMEKEDARKRIMARHGEGAESFNDLLIKLYDLYEPAFDDEPNSININVTSDMSREEVVQKYSKCFQNDSSLVHFLHSYIQTVIHI